MMIRNYAKQPECFFIRMAAKVAVFTMMQYFNFLNQKPIEQVKYACIYTAILPIFFILHKITLEIWNNLTNFAINIWT